MSKPFNYTELNLRTKVTYMVIYRAITAQQRWATPLNKRVNTNRQIAARRSYAKKCAVGYRKNLAACKNEDDHRALYLATEMRLCKTSNEYTQAFKVGKSAVY